MVSQADISLLAEPVPFAFSHKTAPNRFSKAAMTERLCTYSGDKLSRGEPTRELENVYAVWSNGGLGLFHTGNIMVHHAYLEAKGCAVIDPGIPKSYVPAFARLRQATRCHAPTPPLLVGQLTHTGKQVPEQVDKHPLVSTETGDLQRDEPAKWTHEEIRDIVDRFAFAAGVLKDAEFDGVQIHGAYGHFVAQFLSCRLNTRRDAYGGSLENRSRVLFEIIAAIKGRVRDPGFLFSVKLSASDFNDGGLPGQEPQELARKLEEAEVDYIELSGGTYEGVTSDYKLDEWQNHFFAFANQIRSGVSKTKLVVTGGFKTVEFMASAVRNSATDCLARALAHEPTLPSDILAGRTSSAKQSRLHPSLAVNLDAGVAQIQRMGKGLELLDFSDQRVAETWMKARDAS